MYDCTKLLGHEEQIKEKKILSAQINITNSCPCRCLSCRKYEWPQNELKLEYISLALNELISRGITTVVLSGGEPLLHSEFKKIVKLFLYNKIKFSVISTLIAPIENLCLALKFAERVHVSVDSFSVDMYAKLRGVTNSIAVEALNNLETVSQKRKEMGLSAPRISSTISKFNFEQVYDMYTEAKRINCTLKYYMVHTWKELELDAKQRSRFYSRIRSVASAENKARATITNAYEVLCNQYENATEDSRSGVDAMCHVPTISCLIDANGDVYPCCKLLNDNGTYLDQSRFAYGNICNKKPMELKEIFSVENIEENFKCTKEMCGKCTERYNGINNAISSILNPGPLFL